VRDRLLSRERPVATYPCRVASVEETTAAERALVTAHKAANAVKADDKQALTKAKKTLAAAEKARDACYEKIRLQAMEPKAFEKLQDAYPQADDGADEETRKAADESYLHAVFLGTVQGEGMSEEDWTDFVHRNLSTGERNDLYNMSIAINGRVRALDPATPKG
jgi:ParB-like chromosome segregation protein Spo0J